MSPSGDVNCCVVSTWGVWMQLAATPFSDGSIGARAFEPLDWFGGFQAAGELEE